MEIIERALKIKLDSEQSADRNKIIHISTQIETMIAYLLNKAIGTDGAESISFGYSPQALSLNSRINLLIDFNIFTSNEKKFFQAFIEIRNKFAHNNGIKSLHRYLIEENKTQTLKFLERIFSNKINNYSRGEDNTWLLFYDLIDNIELALNKILDHIAKRSTELLITEYKCDFFDSYITLLQDEDFLSTLDPVARPLLEEVFNRILNQLGNTDETAVLLLERLKGRNLL